ncbi:hypothetical protein AAHB49_19080 [Bacillus cereus]
MSEFWQIHHFSLAYKVMHLLQRPMKRVTNPLKQMGANIDGREERTLTPLTIRGGDLKAIEYTSPVVSAQVKSAVLLAGLRAEGCNSCYRTTYFRDHTERMLEAFGVKVTSRRKDSETSRWTKANSDRCSKYQVTYHQLPFLSSRCNYSK